MDVNRLLQQMTDKEFETALMEELEGESLPLEKACLSGGWPDDSTVVKASKCDDDDESIVARFDVAFMEMRQSSCSELEVPDSRYATFEITINRAERSYDFEYVYDDSPEF